ncbi:MAG: DUF378 domain-containing protein [Clostridiales bacterium]|nr:DUF378 domain-containing protein [Clostridiales bacterium]
MNVLALILMILGALNWGLLGIFEYNLLASVFGQGSAVTRILYILIGLSALWGVVMLCNKRIRHRE